MSDQWEAHWGVFKTCMKTIIFAIQFGDTSGNTSERFAYKNMVLKIKMNHICDVNYWPDWAKNLTVSSVIFCLFLGLILQTCTSGSHLI